MHIVTLSRKNMIVTRLILVMFGVLSDFDIAASLILLSLWFLLPFLSRLLLHLVHRLFAPPILLDCRCAYFSQHSRSLERETENKQ